MDPIPRESGHRRTGVAEPLRPEAWLDAHGDVLYRYALSKTGNPDIAQDLVQDTLLAAWRGKQGFHGNSSERSWLLGICRHKTIDHLRRSGREARSRVSWPTDASEAAEFFHRNGTWRHPPADWRHAPLLQAEADGFLAVLDQCIARLPPGQRECFELRELGEMDTAPASRALNVSVNNLYVLLHRARLRLRRCLNAHWFNAGGGRP